MPASVRPEPGSEGIVAPSAPVAAEPDPEFAAEPLAPTRTRPRRRGRFALLAAATVLALVAGYYLVTLYQVWSTGRHDQARPADAIVVLGAAQYDGRPSPLLARRLDHARELYERGLADTIVVTGGKQPLDRYTEAAASARYLQERGVSESAILQETTGRSSWDSLRGAARLLQDTGKTTVLLVSDPAHSLRIKAMAEELGLTAYTSPTSTSSSFGRLAKEAAGVAVGRIIGFDRVEELTG